MAVVFLSAIGAVLAGQWRQARAPLGGLDAPVLLASWALVLAGIYATFRSWRAVLADLGGGLPQAPAMRVFYLGQLGKYLPGTVWPAVTQMRLGRDYRVPPRASGAAFGVFMLLLVGTGLLVGLPVIPLLGRDAADEYRWLALVVPLFALALTPPLLNRVIAVALRAARRPPMPAPLTPGGVLRGAGWAVGSWVCYGARSTCSPARSGPAAGALWLQCTARSRPPSSAAPAAGRPAGAGIREAALLLLLGSTVTAPVAAVIAVVSRLLFVAGDLAWSGVAVVAAGRAVRPPGLLLAEDPDLVGQGLPGDPEDGLDPVPVVLQHPDLTGGGVVADRHGLGPAAGVGPEPLGRDLVELGRQVGQGTPRSPGGCRTYSRCTIHHSSSSPAARRGSKGTSLTARMPA